MSKTIGLIMSIFLFSVLFIGNYDSASARIDYEHLNNYNRACYPLCNLTAYQKTVQERDIKLIQDGNRLTNGYDINGNYVGNGNGGGYDANGNYIGNPNNQNNANNNYSNVGIDPNNPNGANNSNNPNNPNNYYSANLNRNNQNNNNGSRYGNHLTTSGVTAYVMSTLALSGTSGIIWYIRKKRKERDLELNQTLNSIDF